MDLSELKLTPKRKEIADKLNLHTVEDVLSYYPFRYEMYERTALNDFKIGNQICFVGELVSFPSTFRKGKLTTTRFKVLYEEEIFSVTIFNRPWIRNIGMNEEITIIGRYDGNNKITAGNYYTKDILGSIIPYYSLKEGIAQNDIRKLIQFVLEKGKIEEDLTPEELIEKHHLIDHETAIRNIHSPKNKDLLSKSLSRLKYEEFLRFYVALDILKNDTTRNRKEKKSFDEDKINQLIQSFPYELTKDQIQTKNEILHDLASASTMYRLVQGEVGSGKTAVAMIGLYANYLAGYQGALMAPTEILAKQHFESLNKSLSSFGVRIGLLYGSMDKEQIVKKQLENGDIDIIVGTHALFSKDVNYRKLGLVIADEQHRFGVKQRQALKDKGDNCDFILMSATPIPRTLASSIYGDMDISTIATIPSGRKGCKTFLIHKNSIVDILEDIRAVLASGRQVYIIAAAIERNENYQAKDVNGLFQALNSVLRPYKTALMHGRLSSEEKDEIMEKFSRNEIQALISTTVVEVGVNVPNATTMIIYDADRFGLSQLHQLRGRVQRSSIEGSCYLLTDNKDENVLKRLNVLCETNDGFKISYEDLKLRGPGDILGTRQSGLPTFVLGNLIEDTRFINAAREDARYVCDNQDDTRLHRYYEKIEEIAASNYIS
ncbi:MAG: ATP-dependent DNA helicase RecG [Erysipelotrichaceae bacterium]|nr:ATP-dependent DNA helicase RecG [Erysipelotrichaceae bacterium]